MRPAPAVAHPRAAPPRAGLRRLLPAAALLLLPWAPAAPSRAAEVPLTFSTGLASRHVHRGVERSAEAWQAGLEGAAGNWRGRFWSSRPFSTAEPGELQSALGYVARVGPSLELETTGTHFWYVDQPAKGAAAHSFEAALHLRGKTVAGWRPSLGVAYDIRFRSRAVEAALAYERRWPARDVSLACRVYAGHLAGNDVLPDTAIATVRDAYAYCGADVTLPRRISDRLWLVAAAHVAATAGQNPSWSPAGRGSGTRVWLALGGKIDF